MSQKAVSANQPGKILQFVNGHPFPGHYYLNSENISSSLEYLPLDGDIILNSFPKTGTTWVQYIIKQIIHYGDSIPSYIVETFPVVPIMESCGTKYIENLALLPRFYKNYFAYRWAKRNPKAKYIYMYRNPADTLVSYYDFINEVAGRNLEFDDYYERFIEGNIPYGDYFDHFLSYYAHRNDHNLLMVSYEELHEDTRSQILRIAKFLGEEFHQLFQEECRMKRILELTSFDPKKIISTQPDVAESYKNHLSADQTNRLNHRMMEKMKGTAFVDKWMVV